MRTALLSLLISAPLAAQEPRLLEATVTAVQGNRARLELGSDLLPSQGDSVLLGLQMEGVGDVILNGRWQVAELGAGFAWADPVGEVSRPMPWYDAVIFSDNPVRMPDAEAETVTDGAEVLYDAELNRGGTLTEAEGPYCQGRNTPGGFRIRTVAETGACSWNLWSSGSFKPPARISTTIYLEEGDLTWGYGLQFGMLDNSERYFTLMVSGNGSYKLRRWGNEQWTDLTDWIAHPAIDTGIGARNELAVELEGTIIHYSVNGIHLGSHEANEPLGGSLGWNLNVAGHQLLFENIRVERLSEGTPRVGVTRLLREDFSRPRNEFDGPPCTTRNHPDGLSIKNVAPNGTCFWDLWSSGEFSDAVRITAVAHLESGPTDNGYGLRFGTVDKENTRFYVFVITGDGHYQTSRWEAQAGWTSIAGWTRHDAIRTGTGATNSIAVEVRGRTLDLYVNDRFLGTHQVDQPVTGYVGLYVAKQDIEAVFEDLMVEELEPVR